MRAIFGPVRAIGHQRRRAEDRLDLGGQRRERFDRRIDARAGAQGGAAPPRKLKFSRKMASPTWPVTLPSPLQSPRMKGPTPTALKVIVWSAVFVAPQEVAVSSTVTVPAVAVVTLAVPSWLSTRVAAPQQGHGTRGDGSVLVIEVGLSSSCSVYSERWRGRSALSGSS